MHLVSCFSLKSVASDLVVGWSIMTLMLLDVLFNHLIKSFDYRLWWGRFTKTWSNTSNVRWYLVYCRVLHSVDFLNNVAQVQIYSVFSLMLALSNFERWNRKRICARKTPKNSINILLRNRGWRLLIAGTCTWEQHNCRSSSCLLQFSHHCLLGSAWGDLVIFRLCNIGLLRQRLRGEIFFK